MISWMIVVGKKMSRQLSVDKEFLSNEKIQQLIEALLD